LDFGFNFLQNIDGIYVSANATLKKQILCSIFAEKLIFEGRGYRTPAYHEALLLILNAVKCLGGNKRGQTAGNNNLSFLVVPTGIEPVSKV
jgi:site-specific DNA recombinase